jgi:hypothetical protein
MLCHKQLPEPLVLIALADKANDFRGMKEILLVPLILAQEAGTFFSCVFSISMRYSIPATVT